METNKQKTKEIISENIKELRSMQGLTQQKFAEEMGIKRSSVGAYEEGRAEPPLYLIINICKKFRVPIGKFITEPLFN